MPVKRTINREQPGSKPKGRNKVSRRKLNLGCLFWIALLLLMLAIFIANWKTIETTLKSTGFLDMILKTGTPQPSPQASGSPAVNSSPGESPLTSPPFELPDLNPGAGTGPETAGIT
jgi:hypothetical protein